MSRRKQEKPQPKRNFVKGEVPDLQVPDILTCGACRKDFPLADIVRFIQHKVQLCNKENSLGGDSLIYGDSEEDSNNPPTGLIIPKKEEEECPPPKEEEPVSSSSITKMVVNAKDATVNTQDFSHEPRSYTCSNCKQSLSTAWALIQHAQNIHGLSICADPPSMDENLDIRFCSDSSSALFNLRAPLLERQIEPLPLFVRNSSQELRLDLNGKSSNSLSNGRMTPPPLLEPPKITNCEDFYSQRLRVLAGATSPNAASTPRKLLQPNFKAMLNNAKTSPNSCTPPLESSSLSPSQSNNHNNSSASSTTSDHPQTPTSAKSRLCEYCGKSFQFKSNLIVHRRSHTGEKPFKCHICNHACTQASKLKRHMKTHRGKKVPQQLSNGDSKSGEAVENGDCKPNNEKQVNGDGEYNSDEHEDEEMEEEEVDAEDEEEEEVNVDSVEDEDCLRESEGNLVIDQSINDDDMVAEDLTKKPLKNGTGPVENGTPVKKDKLEEKHDLVKHSVISEIMDNIGFGCIPPYNEAYKQALKESSFRNSLKQDRYSSGTEGSASNDAVSHHSYDVMSFHPSERPPREGTRSAGQSPLSFGGGLLDSFDQSLNMKRIRLEDTHKDRESNLLYAGVWFPRVEAPQPQFRDLYGVEAVNNHSSKSETALCLRPGTSQMSLVGKSKDSLQGSRRNDTCEYCGKVFKNCSNLTVHRRSHTGEKPYKCELCSYACAQSSKLTRHMKTHGRLGKDVYRCRFCDMPFSVASTLEKHMRKCVVSQSGNGSPYLVSEPEENSKEMTTA